MTGEHTKRAIETKTQIPWATWARKARKTALGFFWVGLGLAIAIWLVPPLSHWVVYPLVLYGGFCMAGDVARSFGDWFPAFLKDVAGGIGAIYAAVKGK